MKKETYTIGKEGEKRAQQYLEEQGMKILETNFRNRQGEIDIIAENEGYLWVYYSQEGLDINGEIDYGGWNIPSLWKVRKDAKGNWVVTEIKEHP